MKQQQEIIQETDEFSATGNQSLPTGDRQPLLQEDDALLETSDDEHNVSRWLDMPQVVTPVMHCSV